MTGQYVPRQNKMETKQGVRKTEAAGEKLRKRWQERKDISSGLRHTQMSP